MHVARGGEQRSAWPSRLRRGVQGDGGGCIYTPHPATYRCPCLRTDGDLYRQMKTEVCCRRQSSPVMLRSRRPTRRKNPSAPLRFAWLFLFFPRFFLLLYLRTFSSASRPAGTATSWSFSSFFFLVVVTGESSQKEAETDRKKELPFFRHLLLHVFHYPPPHVHVSSRIDRERTGRKAYRRKAAERGKRALTEASEEEMKNPHV